MRFYSGPGDEQPAGGGGGSAGAGRERPPGDERLAEYLQGRARKLANLGLTSPQALTHQEMDLTHLVLIRQEDRAKNSFSAAARKPTITASAQGAGLCLSGFMSCSFLPAPHIPAATNAFRFLIVRCAFVMSFLPLGYLFLPLPGWKTPIYPSKPS